MLKSPSAEESSSNSTPSRNHLVSPLKSIPTKESPFPSSTAVESHQPDLALVDSELNEESTALTHTTVQNTPTLLDNGNSTLNQEVDKSTNESPRFTPAKRPFQPSPVKTPASAIQNVEPIPTGKILQSPDLLSQVSINQPSPMAQQQQQQPHVFPGAQPQFQSPVQQQLQQEHTMPTLQSNNCAFPPKTPQSTSAILSTSQPSGFTDFSEFDPLANNLMSFQSPLPMPKAHNINGTSSHLLHNVLKKQAVATPPPSLLDIAPMVLSPSRVLKYSETDVAAMKKEWSDKVDTILIP
ncbi:hypothetical protein BKA69DRAFT_1041341 [Paraphysoderma sedebokerense]|nr:hypothetical protein BKA69DRAFT_1041341 [Paraphysoderma sedebokerense]